ncbi:hypothetical protein J6590_002809 [Homalodisca vitripennis]|nr:hypothetical protein J6590_002809 [Homalodisca vitripennis]
MITALITPLSVPKIGRLAAGCQSVAGCVPSECRSRRLLLLMRYGGTWAELLIYVENHLSTMLSVHLVRNIETNRWVNHHLTTASHLNVIEEQVIVVDAYTFGNRPSIRIIMVRLVDRCNDSFTVGGIDVRLDLLWTIDYYAISIAEVGTVLECLSQQIDGRSDSCEPVITLVVARPCPLITNVKVTNILRSTVPLSLATVLSVYFPSQLDHAAGHLPQQLAMFVVKWHHCGHDHESRARNYPRHCTDSRLS